jgi:Uma2 family endonuclease
MAALTEASVMQAAVSRRLWTRQEYERMIDAGILVEGEKAELIAGEIVVKPMQKSPHATGVGKGQDALTNTLPAGFLVRVQLPLALDPDSEPEPDLAVMAGTRDDYADEHPHSAILVIEVADSTLWFDRTQKAAIYARAQIPDYWILNLVDRVLEVYRDPAPDAASPLGHGYRLRLTFAPGERISPLAFPDVSIAIDDLLPRAPADQPFTEPASSPETK